MSSLYDSLDIAETYRLLGQHQKSLDYALSHIDHYTERIPNFFARNRYLSGLAVDYVHLGEIEKAESILESVWGPDRAPIYTALGRKEKAVHNLKKQLEEGVQIYAASPKYNYLNKPLFDYPPFQEFVRVKD